MGASVLIVDDSALSRRMMRRILEKNGEWNVLEAADGASALELYALERPAVVVLDLVMAGMYGLDVLTQLLDVDPAARVIIATADIQKATRDEALDTGACGFVGKPFVEAEVLNAVASARVTKDSAS